VWKGEKLGSLLNVREKEDVMSAFSQLDDFILDQVLKGEKL
jgi:hypothetical protein